MPVENNTQWEKQEDWENFVNICEEYWHDTPLQLKLLQLLENNKDIAIVVNYHLTDSAIDWLYRKVPALGNLMPIECLKSEALKIKLKEALWQMP